MKKVCATCKIEKELPDFPSDGGGRFRSKCKKCYNEYTKARRDSLSESGKDNLRSQWREASKRNYTPEKRRSETLARYGLSTEEYDSLLSSQNGVCAICHSAPTDCPRGILFVDHDHQTGHVRGLLCDRCNVGLGCFIDSLDRLDSAMVYLQSRDRAKAGSAGS